MIGTYFDGRLGNQFFRYAFARALRYDRGDKDDFVFNFNSVTQHSKEEGFEDTLQYFNVVPYKTTPKNLLLVSFSLRIWCALILDRLLHKFDRTNLQCFHRFDDLGYIVSREDTKELKIIYPSTLRNIVTSGKFEWSGYFSSIRNILLEEFTPKYPRLSHNEDLYRVIESSNSVCVSIRRGDYLASHIKDSFFVCGKDYFEKAMKLVCEKVENPVFIFFSDDIEWVRENISVDVPAYYESGNDPIWEKLRLMYSCKHFVISNSTFSWWAQYLSRNEQKVVVSPSRWFANPNWVSYLIEDSFLTINV